LIHVDRLYHPSHRVPDLAAAEAFFATVFGRPSVGLEPGRDLPAGYPRDYCAFTLIADVWFDTIDPTRYVFDGVQRYATVEVPHLNGFGWGVQGIDEIFEELRRRGIRCTDQFDRLSDGAAMPTASFSSSPLFWTLAADTGLRYELYPTASIGPLDPRSDPAWTLPPPGPDDPLAIARCSHHTVLTADPARALDLVVDVLGGTVIHEGVNELLETDSTYVALADGVLEYAVPRRRTGRAAADLASTAPLDCYHALTWLTTDLDRVVEHAARCGVGLIARTDAEVVFDPADALGVPWGFRTEPIPGDARAARG
jgi:catechol 2,3-dioxygenase-like lactoylglutathione lyase family enzyme